jgi:hypothetical protein
VSGKVAGLPKPDDKKPILFQRGIGFSLYIMYYCIIINKMLVMTMREKSLIATLLLGMCLLMAYGASYAVEDLDQETSTVTLVIQPACNLTITNEAVSETLTMDSNAESAFGAGFVEFGADKPTLTVSSNEDWKLTVKSSGFTAPYSKKTGDLQLKDASSEHVKNGFSDFKPLSETDQEIASGDKGVKGENHPCQYKILLDYTKDVPGTYEATITYTLSTSAS